MNDKSEAYRPISTADQEERPPAYNPASAPLESSVHVTGVPGAPGSDPGSILPVHRHYTEDSWRVGLFEKCCDCSGFCFMAWCCGCFTIAQISGRLAALDSDANSDVVRHKEYKRVLLIIAILFMLNVMFGINLIGFGCIYFIWVARSKIISIWKFRSPNCCVESLTICCCGPCSLIQTAHQLWMEPSVVPGFDFSSRPCNENSPSELENRRNPLQMVSSDREAYYMGQPVTAVPL